MTDLSPLPITEVVAVSSQDDLQQLVQQCHADSVSMYPLGGQTSLGFGVPARTEGIGIDLRGINQVIDFPVRDLTITVEAGILMSDLNSLLAAEGLMLPLHVPQMSNATLGGVIATNTNGPGRFGYGTVRDYVIGIRALSGDAQVYNAGGRVVKNVAGYDFCKLLTGSLGTLGIITQVTMKLKPIPTRQATVIAPVNDVQHADRVVAELMNSMVRPVAIEFLQGSEFTTVVDAVDQSSAALAIVLHGTDEEVDWMIGKLRRELSSSKVRDSHNLDAESHEQLWSQLCEFAADDTALAVTESRTVSSGCVSIINLVLEQHPECSVQSHMGDGIVTMKLPEHSDAQVSDLVIKTLGPEARRHHGHVVILSAANAAELTTQSVWGEPSSPDFLIQKLREQFDPQRLINPGRFVYQ